MDDSLNCWKAILDEYANGPNHLEAALAGLSDEHLNRSEHTDSWTIRQIVHHIADGDYIWSLFIIHAVGNPGGIFEMGWYGDIPQDQWVKSWAYAARGIESSLALYRANRDRMIQLLRHVPEAREHSLVARWANDFEQTFNITSVVEMQVQHLTAHLDEIRRVRQQIANTGAAA